MSRVVLIVDSESGALIDVAGNVREGGRYEAFAKRLLSLDKNPTLDYGANGGDELTISKGGYPGAAINLKADEVRVSGRLLVGGRDISSAATVKDALQQIKGAPGQIVTQISDNPQTGKQELIVAIDGNLYGNIQAMSSAIASMVRAGYVSKPELADVIYGISVEESDTLEDLKLKLGILLNRLSALVDQQDQSGSE